MRPHQGTGVLVGRDRGDHRDTDHRPGSRPPDDPIGRPHRAPPITKVLVSAIVKPSSMAETTWGGLTRLMRGVAEFGGQDQWERRRERMTSAN